MQNVIEQIHSEFESPLFDLAFFPEEMQKEASFLVEHYRQAYPLNNFVTEKQVADICRKYGLVLGHEIFFSGSVPKRIEKTLEEFRLNEFDNFFRKKESLFETLNKMTIEGNADVVVRFTEGCFPIVEMRTAFREYTSSRTVIPIGKKFYLVLEYNPTAEFWLFEAIEQEGSTWLSFVELLKTGKSENNQEFYLVRKFPEIEYRWNSINSAPAPILEVQLNLPANKLNRENIKLSEVCRKVVAPIEMFNKHADAYEVVDDYELRFREPEVASGDWSRDWLDDPIVLQPVRGGYLVVAKWGGEAYLEEVQNPRQN